MSQETFYIGVQGTDLYIKSVIPKEITEVESEQKVYTNDVQAITDATYLNGLQDGNTYFVGSNPKPR